MTIKRLIATSLLASSLALTSVPGHALESQAPVSQAEITFKDMLGKEWYFADVMTLVKQGIIGGYPDGTFGPAKTITFAEFLAISLKSVTKDIQGSPTGSHWAMGIYMTAIDKGIITGDEFGKSRDDLNAPISREDMALILIRLNELIQEESKQETANTQAKVPDFARISKNRQYYVLQAYEKGLIGGKASGFDPKGKATRAEASIVVLRLIDESRRGDITDIVVGPTDQYGRVIRTTNLPKNADWFPYIVEGVPNWAYEQQPFDDNYFGPSVNTLAPKGASKTGMLPKHVHASEDAISNVVATHYDKLEEFLEHYLNVDYRTMDQKKYADVLTNMTDIRVTSFKSEKDMHDLFYSYTNYVKRNKVIMEAEFEILPETSWTTVGDQIGVLNVGVYVKLLPKQVLNGAPFNMPGSLSLYGTGVKKSSIKAGQELEGVITVTLLRTGYGEWKTFYGSFSPLGELDPLTDVLNGVAPSKKSPNRLEKLKYSWTRDPDQYYTRYDRNAKAGFSLQ